MFRVKEITSEYTKKITCDLHGKLVKIIDIEDEKKFCILPEKTTVDFLQKIKSMKVYDDDIWILTNPKCGTTWTQEMVWMLANDLNYDKALKIDIDTRIPFLELEGIMATVSLETESVGMAETMTRPRIMNSHLPAFLLPIDIWLIKPKIIYTIRNPKDASVSWFHHHVNFHGWKEANMKTFIEAFVNDKMFYSPFNDHVLKFWEDREKLNILFLHFEDMKKDLKAAVEKTANFLGKSYSKDQIEKLCDHLSFDSMKNNRAVNNADLIESIRVGQGREKIEWSFIRKGKVGSHKEELTPELIKLLDEYVEKIDTEKTGFSYKFK